MRSKGLRSPAGAAMAVALALGGLGLGVLSFRAAAVRSLPPASPAIIALAAHHPDVVLAQVTSDIVTQRGILKPAQLAAVRQAAAGAPLDARAFLVLGHQQLLDNQPARAVKTLETGRLLDPRQRLIHLLLLDRYLRTQRYTDAATEFSVLARLVGSAQGPIAAAVAEMSKMPDTRDAARRTLRSDPMLERSVLATLAASDVAPATIFELASPSAQRDARASQSWGPVLIARLIKQGRYGEAHAIWRRIYGLPDAQATTLLYDAGLQGLSGSPPFNWTLATSSLGAVDMRAGTLAVDYYGRESGDLATQLLVLRPGSYRFRFSVEGGKTGDAASLFWSLRCATGTKAEVMRVAVAGSGTRRPIASGFTVPAGCSAQQLALTAEAGEFPVPVNVTLRDLDLRPASGGRP